MNEQSPLLLSQQPPAGAHANGLNEKGAWRKSFIRQLSLHILTELLIVMLFKCMQTVNLVYKNTMLTNRHFWRDTFEWNHYLPKVCDVTVIKCQSNMAETGRVGFWPCVEQLHQLRNPPLDAIAQPRFRTFSASHTQTSTCCEQLEIKEIPRFSKRFSPRSSWGFSRLRPVTSMCVCFCFLFLSHFFY